MTRPTLCVVLLLACDGGGAASPSDATRGLEDATILRDALPTDAMVDASPDAHLAAGYGEACRSVADCPETAPHCVVTLRQGPLCTSACGRDDDCRPVGDEAFECRAIEDGETWVCAPAGETLCAPCFEDANCFGGRCVEGVCGRDCSDECPAGFGCVEGQCRPESGTCECLGEEAGATRLCVTANEAGRCVGKETCEPGIGWIDCDARAPVLELCDGLDDNCNGVADDGLAPRPCVRRREGFEGGCEGLEICRGRAGWDCIAPEPAVETCDQQDEDCDGAVDEDFRDAEGRYLGLSHCGACGNDCAGRFELAAETACALDEGVPRCTIVECLPGYRRAGPTACVPLDSSLCAPCQVDADCNAALGDRCLSYGETSACGRDCGADSIFGVECPPDYACDEGQCRLARGTCLCGPQEAFVRPCRVRSPADEICVGSQTCERGELSGCALPEESCSGIDDDCEEGRVVGEGTPL